MRELLRFQCCHIHCTISGRFDRNSTQSQSRSAVFVFIEYKTCNLYEYTSLSLIHSRRFTQRRDRQLLRYTKWKNDDRTHNKTSEKSLSLHVVGRRHKIHSNKISQKYIKISQFAQQCTYVWGFTISTYTFTNENQTCHHDLPTL